jgi:non-lysosomal glucosylceramidase
MNHRSRQYAPSATQAAFPLGGIGSGNVSLGVRGNLQDWEIFNAPAKGTYLPNTFACISALPHGGERTTRILEGPITGTHALSHGYHPHTAYGLPRFATSSLSGTYPIAELSLSDDAMPVTVSLEAFTPFVPLNPIDSGMPAAVFNYTVTNTSASMLDITLAFSLYDATAGVHFDKYGNLSGPGGGLITYDASPYHQLNYRNTLQSPAALEYAELALATTHPDVSYRTAWLRGGWWDYVQDFWDDIHGDGRLTDPAYATPASRGAADTGSLAAHLTLAPGAQQTVSFMLAWYVPNRRKTWEKAIAPLTQNHYATIYPSAAAVVADLVHRQDTLTHQTRQFRDVLEQMTLPEPMRDALAATIVPMRSTTCFWLADGDFYGWEGCFDDSGCCPGSCTHVWSYAYAMAYLFPQLERVMRTIEFTVETEADGYMIFRTFQKFGEEFVWGWGDQRPEACIDGQMGCVLRAWREWQLSGDRPWLDAIYPGLKRAVDYADAHWDTDRDGVPDGRQHNTYDIEFYGANPLSTLYYLAGLQAGAALADVVGDGESAARWRACVTRGQQRFVELCWNGKYFIQHLDDVDAERYQHGQGILTDQLLGQLHATLLDLGDLVPREMVEQTLQAIVKHNFRVSFQSHVNTQRTYVLEDEQGLVLCSWPNGGRPRFPFVYSDEVWTGIEYHVAAHLLTQGDLKNATRLVKALRARHDGTKRNPWNEVECGHHYARSMAAWMLLPASTGFACNVAEGWMRFDPPAALLTGDTFVMPWFTQQGWGMLTMHRQDDGSWSRQVDVLAGECTLTVR